MKLALFTPLNPVKTGISDYTEEMLPALSRYFDIDIYIDKGYQPQNQELLSAFRVIPFDPNTFDPSAYTEILYHMGNYYRGHHYIYACLEKHPGITVLHDYVMQGFYAERFEATGEFSPYRNLLTKYYGEKGKEIADQIIDRSRIPIWESEASFDFPLNEEIIEFSKGLIVHSRFIQKKVQAITKKPVVKINHHGHIIKKIDSAAVKRKLGVKPDELLICSAGFVNKNKRYGIILAALDELKEIPIKYVIAGKDRGQLLKNYISPSQNQNIIVLDHLPLTELEQLIGTADICINLRYPTMGESSGSLLRMMGYGKPTLVSNYGSYTDFPNYSVLKINPDIDEKEMIKKFVRALAADDDFARSLGREAANYVQTECGIEKCAKEYSRFIRSFSFTSTDQKQA